MLEVVDVVLVEVDVVDDFELVEVDGIELVVVVIAYDVELIADVDDIEDV